MIGTQSTLSHSKSIIRYHDPYPRLNLRAKVDHIIQSNPKFHHIILIDVFPMLDAVMKRGGCQKVKSRMQQILLSLPYYDTNLIKKSIQIIGSLQKQQQFQSIISGIQYIGQPFIQQHLLPATSSQGYYELTKQQTIFARQNFSHIDQYLTIKTLAYFGAVFNKLGNAYIDKYYKLRRWLYINDIITNVRDEQFVAINKLHPKQNVYMQMNMNMGIPINNPYNYPQRICVVGITLANLIMSVKLSKLGYYVKLVERSYQNLFKWSAGFIPDLIRQGIFLNNEIQAKRLNEVLFNYVGAASQPVDSHFISSESEQSSKRTLMQIKDPLLRYESTFIILLEQILSEFPKNAGKLFWQQLYHKIMTFNNNPQYRNSQNRSRNRSRINERIDIDGMRMYFERFIMLNKIKDELIMSVSDMKRFVEEYYMVEKPVSPYNNLVYRNSKIKMSINNLPYFLKPEKMKIKKYQELISKDKVTNSNLNLNVCVDSQVKKIEYKENMWQITLASLKDNKIFVEQFTHLIYSESQSLQKSMKQRCFLPQLANPINFPIFQQLNSHTQIHCLYRFTQSIQFRGTNNNKSIFTSYCSQIVGTINFYILSSKCEVFACLRKSVKYPQLDYYRQIYNILYDHILKNSPKLEYPKEPINENIQQCRYFSLKQQKILENIIKLRQKQNMYLSVPIICMYGNNSKNIVQNQMKINNKIITLICHSQSLYLRRSQNNLHPSVMPMKMPLGQPLPMSYSSMPSYMAPHKQVVVPNVVSMPIGSMHMGMNMVPIQINPYQINLYEEQKKEIIIKPIHEDLFVNKKDMDENKIKGTEKSKKDEMDIEVSQNAKNQIKQIVCINQPIAKAKETVLSSIHQCEIINNIKQILWTSTQQITHYMTLLTNSSKVNYSLARTIPHFPINMPLPISNSLYIVNMGLPALSSLQIASKDVFFQNMVILSLSRSLMKPSSQAILYNACILYEEVPIHCLIQVLHHPHAKQGCLDMLMLFHTSAEELSKCIEQIWKQNENESNIGEKYKKVQKNKHLMIGSIEKGIRQQLYKSTNERVPKGAKQKSEYYGIKCSEILKKKVEKIKQQSNNQKQNVMHQEGESIITKLAYTTADLVTIIYSQADTYVNYLCCLFRLRRYSLCDLFVGKLNLKYIVSEIEDNFDKQNNTDRELKETQTMILWLKQQINKHKLVAYPLGIYKDQNIVIKRKFISIDQQGYLILQQLGYQPTIDDLNPYPSSKQNKQRNGQWMKSVIQRLIQADYSIYELLQQLQKLVRQQMQQIIDVINTSCSAQHRKVFTYFAMTRMDFSNDETYKRKQPDGTMERSAKRLQKLKEQMEKELKAKQNQSMHSTLDDELEQISDMIHEGNIIFDGNQVFASFYS